MTPFDSEKRVLVIGDIYIDTHADHGYIRLGGVFHAARTLHAIGATYAIAFLAPSYLHESIQAFLKQLGCIDYASVGEVHGAPGVVIIKESLESGDIGYDDLLREARRVQWNDSALLALLERFAPTDILIFPGAFPLENVIIESRRIRARLHVDGQYLPSFVDDVIRLSPLDTVFLSAPSTALKLSGGDPSQLWQTVRSHITSLVIKENRGGSRAFFGVQQAEAPAFPTKTIHSIGVGDCFDALVITAHSTEPVAHTLGRAAYYASSYASTFDHDVFVDEIAHALKIDANVCQLSGKRLRWEQRPQHHVYLAAPDFPDVATTKLDSLEAALRYHNFSPHRPIKENGLAIAGSAVPHQRALFRADIELIDKCSLLIAVPLTADPGTFAELGYFSALHRPTILYEATAPIFNLFVRNCASRVCSTLGGVIDSVFELLG